jgi:putative DNA methylase
LETKGEEGAAALMKDVGAIGEVARDLAYRLYSICERKKWAKDALRYNGLIVSWSGVSSLSQQIVKEMPKQTALALGERGA